MKVFNCPSRGQRKSEAASWGSVYAMNDYAGVQVEWLNLDATGNSTVDSVPELPHRRSAGSSPRDGTSMTDNPAMWIGPIKNTGP